MRPALSQNRLKRITADPIGTGLVSSLARPGGDATGLSMQIVAIALNGSLVQPIYDYPIVAVGSDPLDEELRRDGIEMIAPHRANRSKPPTQDRRRLSRFMR